MQTAAWIDTHCHLDAPEFAADVVAVRERARSRGVAFCVLPAVQVAHFESLRLLAHRLGDGYALGIHPLYVAQAQASDLQLLDAALTAWRDDPRLLAVGEIGLDYFVPDLRQGALRARQEHFYLEQLKLARKHGLPVILHVRRSADLLLKGLRAVMGSGPGWSGIAHAFNGSMQQARAVIELGLKLGFGGALTYERASRLRQLATQLPLEALVLETDAPDMPPQWRYTPAALRAQGEPQGRNEPGELAQIAVELARLRNLAPKALCLATGRNALAALPKLARLAPSLAGPAP